MTESAPDPELPGLEGARHLLDMPQAALAFLRSGQLEVAGRLVDASNATLFCTISGAAPGIDGSVTAACVYKPVRGERPLYDFPSGTLSHREVAAHAVSAAVGWDIVPPTVLRDGPYGPGMVQLWIDVDERVDVVELIQSADPRLRRFALFDAVVNNADRKGGHLLPAPDGRIYGVDHGICFAEEPKLRTLLWAWRGVPFDADELTMLGRVRSGLDGSLGAELGDLLAPAEVDATARRAEHLIHFGVFPEPDPERPAIPWPPF